MSGESRIVPIDRIEKIIYFIRGQKVILDEDLAELYGVETRRLNEQVRRNRARFPDDFVYPLSLEEFRILKSQFATSRWGGRRKPPNAFTEHGAIMAATVLNSPRAVHVSIQVVRTFIRLRELLASHKELARKLDALEKKYDQQFRAVFDAIRELMTPLEPTRRPMGFHAIRKQHP